MSPKKETFRPGQTVPASGIYSEIDVRGVPTGRNVTSVEGEPFPATQSSDYTYLLKTLANP